VRALSLIPVLLLGGCGSAIPDSLTVGYGHDWGRYDSPAWKTDVNSSGESGWAALTWNLSAPKAQAYEQMSHVHDDLQQINATLGLMPKTEPAAESPPVEPPEGDTPDDGTGGIATLIIVTVVAWLRKRAAAAAAETAADA